MASTRSRLTGYSFEGISPDSHLRRYSTLVLMLAPKGAKVVDTAPLALDEIIAHIEDAHAAGQDVARVHSGDPSLYGARVREAWRAWRELPRYRILQRADLMAQVLYLVLTVICIFYLIVISIDWYDGVIRIGETWYRQIAIDGRYRDFPIWSFVIPSFVLMAWMTLTILRSEPASRADRWAKALSFGRLLGYDGSKGFVRMDRSYSRVRPILPEIALSFLLIFWAAVMVVTEGAIKLHDGGAGGFVAVDGGRWVIGTLFWNTQADWFGGLAILMAIPYLATIYVSLREPLAEPPPDSYTSKW